MLNSCEVNLKVGQLSSHTCDCSLWAPWHQVHTHLSTASFAAFFPCSTKFAYCKQRLNAVKWGYKSVCFVAHYNFLHCQASLNKARTKWVKQRCKSIRYTLAENFTSWVGPYSRIVEPFKHLLRATAQPQFLALELRAPMGACPGQYGMQI